MKKSSTYALLGLALGILVLDHLSSSAGPVAQMADAPSLAAPKYSTNLWTAEINGEKIIFESSDAEIFALHLPPYSDHVRTRAFNLVTYSRNPVLVTQWKVAGDYRLSIVDPILEKEQLVISSRDEIYVEASEDNRIAVEYFDAVTSEQLAGEEHKRFIWPQTLQ